MWRYRVPMEMVQISSTGSLSGEDRHLFSTTMLTGQITALAVDKGYVEETHMLVRDVPRVCRQDRYNNAN